MVNFIFLFIFALVLFFTGSWLLPITDPTESVYALTAKEMLAAGDWLSPRIYGDFWFDKPIMFYWELLIAYKIFGVGEFASRFFPAVFATLGMLLTYFFGAKLYGKKIGFAVSVARRDNRHDVARYVFNHADDFLSGLPRKKSATVFNFVRGVGRGGLDEGADWISFARTYNLNFFGVAERFIALERTFPREKFFALHGDNFNLVSADDFYSRLGVH